MKRILLFSIFCLTISFTKAQIITTVAGNDTVTGGYSGDGGQATAAGIPSPYDVAIDAAGNLYIADGQSCRIRKVDNAGIITTVVGTSTPGHSGDGGQASLATINDPGRLFFDISGNMYIADGGNSCIRMVNTAGIISTIAGDGTYSFGGDGGLATAAKFRSPTAVVLDAAGNIYIADCYNNRIRMINTAGIISTIAGNGTAGYSGDGGQATLAELNHPSCIAIDDTGKLFIADASNNVIRMIDTNGIISTIVGNNAAGYSGDGGQAINAAMHGPNSVIIDSQGNIYISDGSNNRIRKVNTAGIITTIAGDGFYSYGGDGGLATAAELRGPEGIAFDATGNLYIADAFNYCVRKVTNVGIMGINQLAVNSEQLTVYPNPAVDELNVHINQFDKSAHQLVEIYNMLGASMYKQIATTDTYQINLTGLQTGLYFLKVETNGQTEIKKFTKN